MKKLRTGLIGCGKVADFHAKAYVNIEESEFTAVCDNDEARAKAFAERYGVKAYTDVKTMIKDAGLDEVSVCTPHPLHVPLAYDAASCGCNVLIEKPLAITLDDCRKIIEAGKEFNVTVGTMVQRRFYRPCMRIKKAIDDGKLGTPILGTVNMFGWRDEAYYKSDPWRGTWKGEGGGVMVNQAPHQMDLLLWYMGEIDEVYGIDRNFNHPYIEVEDTAVAIVKFKNGGIGNILVSNSQNPALYGKVAVYGSNGAAVGVQTDGGQMFIAGVNEISESPYNDIWTIPGEADKLAEMQQSDRDFWASIDNMYYYHQAQIQDFITSINNGTRPLVTAEDGMKTVELYNAIYESSRTGNPVKF